MTEVYTTPIDEITYSRIAEFVRQKKRESVILDYKEVWPNDLDKTIAAMANTQGGVILVGVAEEEKTGLPRGIVGVDIGQGEDQLRQRVVSQAYQGIYPPVMPEIVVRRLDQDTSRAVIVIRVDQSDRTPHAVDQRRKVYVRVDSTSQPHSWQELATLDQLAWLWDRRKKAVEARDALIAAAVERSTWMVHRKTHQDQKSLLRAWIVPYFYSGEQVLTPETIKHLLERRPLRSAVGGGRVSFPYSENRSRSISSGYCAYNGDPRVVQYYELGTGGLVFSEIAIEPGSRDDPEGQKVVGLLTTLSLIDGMLQYADLAHSEGRTWGLLWVYASLQHAQGALLDTQNLGHLGYKGPESHHQSPDDDVVLLDQPVDTQLLEDSRRGLVEKAAWTLVQAFGLSWEQAEFEKWFSSKAWHDS